MKRELLLGAVAYDPKVVTIWEGFRAWLRGKGLAFDYVLYSNYERQVEDLVAGRIEARLELAARVGAGQAARAGGRGRAAPGHHARHRLRPDVGRRRPAGLGAATPTDLRGGLVATGAVDSPQATLLPLSLLRARACSPAVRRVSGTAVRRRRRPARRPHRRRTRRGPGSGRRRGRRGLHDRRQPAALRPRGRPSPAAARVIARTPPYDHCTMTAGPAADADLVGHVRRAAAGACRTRTRGCGRCSTSKASSSGGRAGSTATSSSNAPSTSRLLRQQRADRCQRLSTLTGSAWTPAGICSSIARLRRCRPAAG